VAICVCTRHIPPYTSIYRLMTEESRRRRLQESHRRRLVIAAAAKESSCLQESLNTTELPPPPLPPSSAAVRTRLYTGFLALSVSDPVRRNPSPVAPPRFVLNNKHPCNPKPVCCSISSAFLPRAAGGRIEKEMSYVCHI
jgi:hypothetical protein